MSVGPSLFHPDGPLIRMHKERIMNDPSNALNQVHNGRSMPVSAVANNFSQVLRMPEYHSSLPSLALPSYSNVGSGAQRNFFYHGNGFGVSLLPYIKEEKTEDSRSRSPMDTKTSSLDSHLTASPKPASASDTYGEIDEVPESKPQMKLELRGGGGDSGGRMGGVERRVGDRTIDDLNDLNNYHKHSNSANNNNNKIQQMNSGNSPSGLMMGRSSHQMLHQGQPILRYSPTGDALLTVSAVGYGDHEMLSESVYNNQLGSILGINPGGGGGGSGGGNSGDSGAFDMFNGEGRQENYVHDIQLSPPTFSNNAETYGINDNSNHEPILEDAGRSESVAVSKGEEARENKCVSSSALPPLSSASGAKLKNGSCRPNKSSGSPNRSSTLPCPVCSKVFSNSSALAKHKLTHSDERKYVCQLCTKAFKRQDHLNGHLLTHMNKKPYECKVEGCGKSYCDARSLRRHTENHHAQVAQASAAAAAAVSAIAIRMAAPVTEAETNSFLAAALQNNRIRYAPPPTSSTPPSTVSGIGAAGTRASPKPSFGGDNTSAATQLQLLAFQQSAATQDPSGAPIPAPTTSASATTWHQQQNVLFINSSLCRMVNETNVDKTKVEVGIGGEGEEAMSVLERHLKMEMNRAKHLQGSTIRGSSNEVATSILPSLHPLSLSSQSLPVLSFGPKNQWPSQGSTFNAAALEFGSGDPKPVECNICHRQFKNIPALNGHMRLHGGYIKRDADGLKKSSEKKSELYTPSNSSSAASHSPLHTASINVRALIEEKIIQKRIINPVLNVPTQPPTCTSHHPQHFLNLPPTPHLSPPPTSVAMEHQHIDSHTFINLPDMIDEENVEDDLISYETCSSVLPPPTIQPPPPPRPTLSGNDVTMDEDATSSMQRQIEIIKQGLMSHQPILEKFRRHSDSDHFLAPSRPTYHEMYDPASSASFLDYMRQKIGCKRTQRTGSDPGEFLVGAQLNDDMFAGDLEIGDLEAGDDDDVVQAADIMDFEMVESGVEPDSNSKGNHASSLLAAALCSTPTSNLMDVIEGISSPFVDHLQLDEPPIPDHEHISDGDTGLRGGSMDVAEDDDVFLNPSSLPPSSPNIKKKHRPEPLHIPPQVSTCGYQSRLRSPRLWDPSVVGKIMSPPPYTPPPMLSPVRSGPGLFWHVLSGSGSITPKSAPITPGRISVAIDMVPQTYEEMSESFSEPPETDILPHVNIGSSFQACLPICRRTYDKKCPDSHLADLVWDPKIEDMLTEKELEMYLQFACCAAVPGGGRNKEYALHILHMTKGNIQEAMLKLMDPAPRLPKKHPLFTYTYAENDRWSVEEIKTYQHALIYCDKDFLSIAQEVKTKTVQQCVQFYYLWKKICPEEYKRLRIIRRKREMDGNYNLRSKLYGGEEGTDGDQAQTPKSEDRGSSPGQPTDVVGERFMCDHPDCFASFSSRQALNGHIRIHGGNNLSLGRLGKGLQDDQPYSPSTNSVSSAHPAEVLEDFPCKVCGKVFHKVKSRNAHMKSHRGTVDSDRHK